MTKRVTTVVDRWDADQNRWRHYLLERNSEGFYETVEEVNEIGLSLKEKTR